MEAKQEIMLWVLCMLIHLPPGDQLLLQRYVEQHAKPSLSDGLFDLQREAYADKARRRTVVCGRRSGKTVKGCRLTLWPLAEYPRRGEDESITAYVAPTKNHAKRLLWGRLQVVAAQFKMPITFRSGDLIATHTNGSQAWIMGADDDRDVSRLLGFAYRRIIIDEAQAIGADFRSMVDDVLDPALADYDGDLILMGTPNAACTGYFYEASTGQIVDSGGISQWKNFHWNILDNSMFPLWRGKKDWKKRAADWLAEKRRQRNWDEDHPTFVREWLGQWVRDEGGLIIKYNPQREHYDELPTGYRWEHVLGVDLGRGTKPRSVRGVPKGNFAMHVWAFCQDLPDLYSVYQYKKQGLELSQWADKIKEVQQRFKPRASVADTGALGAVIVDDLRARLGIHLDPAEKSQKNAAIDLYNSDAASGWIHVKKGSLLAAEQSILQWDDSRTKEDPRFPNDLNDAALYSFREARHWAWRPRDKAPEYGTPEYWELESKKMRTRRIKETKRRRR